MLCGLASVLMLQAVHWKKHSVPARLSRTHPGIKLQRADQLHVCSRSSAYREPSFGHGCERSLYNLLDENLLCSASICMCELSGSKNECSMEYMIEK